MDMPQGRGKRGMRNLANALTGFRLFGAVGLLSAGVYAVLIAAV